MGQTVSKEEVVIAQTAAGGNNAASATQQMNQINTTLIFIAVCLGTLILCLVAYLYRRCHNSWIQQEVNRRDVERAIHQTK